jgi:hypothetical protein
MNDCLLGNAVSGERVIERLIETPPDDRKPQSAVACLPRAFSVLSEA